MTMNADPPQTSHYVMSMVIIGVLFFIFGFVTWLPVFFGQQGLNLTRSLAYTMVLAIGAVVGL